MLRVGLFRRSWNRSQKRHQLMLLPGGGLAKQCTQLGANIMAGPPKGSLTLRPRARGRERGRGEPTPLTRVASPHH